MNKKMITIIEQTRALLPTRIIRSAGRGASSLVVRYSGLFGGSSILTIVDDAHTTAIHGTICGSDITAFWSGRRKWSWLFMYEFRWGRNCIVKRDRIP